MKRKTLIVLLFVSFMLFESISAFALNQYDDSSEITFNQTKADWTVMYYMCGDAYMGAYINPLVSELKNLGSNNDLNIVALVDEKGKQNTHLVYFNESNEIVQLNEIFNWPDEVDTGELNTLESFCTEMMTSYPADHYALVTFVCGGQGWQQYCIDEAGSNAVVTIPEFANSLCNIYNKVDSKIDVLFASCAYSMFEIGYEFSPYLDYLVATQDCFPHEHVVPLFFDAVRDLKNNTQLSPEEFASKSPENYNPVTFIYQEGYGEKISPIFKILDKLPFEQLHSVKHHSNVGVMNLTVINELCDSFNDLTSLLLLSVEDEGFYSSFYSVRNEVQEIGKCGTLYPLLYKIYRKFPFEFLAYDTYVDLYDLITLTKQKVENPNIRNKCDLVLEKINNSVSAVAKCEGIQSNGISIYFPDSRSMYNRYRGNGEIPMPYEGLGFSEDTFWDEFLKAFLQ